MALWVSGHEFLGQEEFLSTSNQECRGHFQNTQPREFKCSGQTTLRDSARDQTPALGRSVSYMLLSPELCTSSQNHSEAKHQA